MQRPRRRIGGDPVRLLARAPRRGRRLRARHRDPRLAAPTTGPAATCAALDRAGRLQRRLDQAGAGISARRYRTHRGRHGRSLVALVIYAATGTAAAGDPAGAGRRPDAPAVLPTPPRQGARRSDGGVAGGDPRRARQPRRRPHAASLAVPARPLRAATAARRPGSATNATPRRSTPPPRSTSPVPSSPTRCRTVSSKPSPPPRSTAAT